MTIEAVCPQGHKIRCPDDKAGKTGKCPKCGKPFKIPAGNKADNDAVAEQQAEVDDTIEFLCPNGHRLSGPASLQGKPGQCPHCDERFIIPDYSEEDDEDSDEAANGVPDSVTSETDEIDEMAAGAALQEIESLEEIDGAGELPEFDVGESVPVEDTDNAPTQIIEGVPLEAAMPGGMQIGAHPMARTFEVLWSSRENGARVELHLNSGDTVLPDRYAAGASQQDQGIFGIKNDDGTYTVIAVTWDAVTRIAARGASQLPAEWFG